MKVIRILVTGMLLSTEVFGQGDDDDDYYARLLTKEGVKLATMYAEERPLKLTDYASCSRGFVEFWPLELVTSAIMQRRTEITNSPYTEHSIQGVQDKNSAIHELLQGNPKWIESTKAGALEAVAIALLQSLQEPLINGKPNKAILHEVGGTAKCEVAVFGICGVFRAAFKKLPALNQVVVANYMLHLHRVHDVLIQRGDPVELTQILQYPVIAMMRLETAMMIDRDDIVPRLTRVLKAFAEIPLEMWKDTVDRLGTCWNGNHGYMPGEGVELIPEYTREIPVACLARIFAVCHHGGYS